MLTKYLMLPFLFALFLQMFVCFKIQKDLWKISPIVIDLLVFIYAGARFLGILKYAGDTLGIYDSGLTDGVFIGIIAVAGLIGIVFAWLIYYFIGWRKAQNTRSR